VNQISATEAARHFSDLLDAVEHRGEGFAIIRRGRVVARLSPIARGTGRQLKRLLAEVPPDPAWSTDLAALRASVLLEDRP